MKQLLMITLIGLFTTNITYANTETLQEIKIPTLKTKFKEIINIEPQQKIETIEEIPESKLDLSETIDETTEQVETTQLDTQKKCSKKANGKTICATAEKMNVRKDVTYY